MDSTNENLEKEFLSAAEKIKKSGKNLDNDMLLKLYGYYKQATIGNCNIDCPAFWQVNDKAKWEAWDQHKGIKKTHAMKKYIKLVDKILSE
jgi:diazepam-binding inhibitor (GABA receptor modulating acyl-CoA-binding protein)